MSYIQEIIPKDFAALLFEDTDKNQSCFIKVSAPGKVILHGEHSVVYGHLAIAASLGKRTHLTLRECSSENELSLNFINLKESSTFSIEEIYVIVSEDLGKIANVAAFEHPESSNHSLLLQKIDLFLKNFNNQSNNAYKIFIYLFCTMVLPFFKSNLKKSIKIEIKTDLEISSGMGSSASFAVSIAAALYEYLRIYCYSHKSLINADIVEFIQTCHRNKRSEKLIKTSYLHSPELQLISAWAFQGEKITHGNPSGVDNTICTYGSIVQFRKGEKPKPLGIMDLKCLLVDTGVPKNTKALVEKVAKFKNEFPEKAGDILIKLNEIAKKACVGFTNLNSRNLTQKQSKEIYECLGKLADKNQELLRQLGVSHETIEEICFILKTSGFNPKITGAGGGGFVITLVPPTITNEKINRTIDKLEVANYKGEILTLGDDGVTIH